MSQQVDTKFSTGRIRFNFADDDGEVFASCLINPTDIELAERWQHVSDEIDKISKTVQGASGEHTIADVREINDKIEQLIEDALGYEGAKDELFGHISATTISPDGTMFATCIVNRICEVLTPELTKRRRAMQTAAEKYTAKYEAE